MAKRRGKKKTSSKKEVRPQHELPGGFWRQVLAILMIAAAVVLVFTWFGEGGDALNKIHAALVWAIGLAVYLLPFLLVYLAVKIFRSDTNELPAVMWIASLLMVVWGAGMAETIKDGKGGVLGEALNGIVTQILEPGVAIFIYVVLIFITGIFILQVSPLAAFRWMAGVLKSKKKEEAGAQPQKADAPGMDIKINGAPEILKKKEPIPAMNMKVNKPKVAEPAAVAPETNGGALVSVSDPKWKMPTVDLLEKKQSPPDPGNVNQNAYIIRSTFADFGIEMDMGDANVGPRVTQYTMKPPSGINLSKILARDKELALAVGVDRVRIEAPIPGTRLVGVELPNVKQGAVTLRSILDSSEWKKASDPLTFAVGKDISGKAVVANLAKMPHLLVAGTTGSGKSVMTNTLITSLLYRNAPSDLKMIIVDPKQVEMVQYSDIPHLLTPIINSTEKALSAMKWAVEEMERRYTLMSEERVKKIEDYNAKVAKGSVTKKDADGNDQKHDGGKMPYIVIVIDEMADLMMQAGKDLEALIVRIAQKGRASGIHLVLATQRPEVKVITGLIKANVPGRIAFAVKSNMDSRIMLDQGGAEKLLGKGDMLLLTTEMMGKAYRIQGAFASDQDIDRVTEFLKEQRPPEYNDEVIAQPVQIKGMAGIGGSEMGGMGRQYDPNDPVVRKAVEITIKQGKFSTASLQTWLGKGHGFVAGLAIWLEELGVIGPSQGNKPRDVMIQSMEEFDQLANQ